MRNRRPDRRGDARAHRRDDRAGHAQMRPRRRDLRCRHARRRRLRRRLSGDRAAAAVGRGRLGAASDLGRQADADAARARSSRSPAATSAITARCRARSSSASRRRPFSMPRRRCWKAWRPGLEAARPGNTCEDIANAFFAVLHDIRHRQGQPHRLSDRAQLSAGLGRAHDEPAPRRPHRAASPA